MRETIVHVIVMAGLLLIPHSAWAQAEGSIAGVVRDTTGAVLPGVTVEAASPALIEKVRTVVTDSAGEYKIQALRPGTYSVTFSLTGFNTYKRDGIELPTGFTATVNAEMKVGAVEETITVTGASPVVDTQNVRTENVLSHQLLDALPTNRGTSAMAALTLGVSSTGTNGGLAGSSSVQDVGGNMGERYAGLAVHRYVFGRRAILYDGMRFNQQGGAAGGGGGPAKHIAIDQNDVQELTVETSGMSAEYDTSGVQLNVVPKSGGNTFSGNFGGTGLNGKFQANNVDAALIARGVTTVAGVKSTYDVGGALGGPIAEDRLWFFTAHRWWGAQQNEPNPYNLTQGTAFYTPDPTHPGYIDQSQRDNTLRLTGQFAKHKLTVSMNDQSQCGCNFYADLGIHSPEADVRYMYDPLSLIQATWSYPATSRLLFQAGYTKLTDRYNAFSEPESPSTYIPYFDLTRNYNYNAFGAGLGVSFGNGFNYGQQNQRFSMSYITGSHAFKVGGFTLEGTKSENQMTVNQDMYENFVNPTGLLPIPSSITEFAGPSASIVKTREVALYGQDQWTLKRLTLNLGLRFEYFNGYVPAQVRPAGEFTPAIPIAEIDNVPNFKDLDPRIGAAYDLFGNGKTALKASVGRYVSTLGGVYTENVSPAFAVSSSTTRSWTDTNLVNGNYVLNCNLLNPAANGGCGAINNKAFGTVVVQNHYAADVLQGWSKRPYNWQTAVSVQQELRPGTAVNLGFFRGSFGNFAVTDNTLVQPNNYDHYCITAPADSRLPGGGGYKVCDLFDVNPAQFGLVNNVVTQSSNFGNQSQVFTGIDAVFTSRFGHGGVLTGGMSTGHTVTQCVNPNLPTTQFFSTTPTLQFCNIDPPFTQYLQFKVAGNYPLPWWGLQAAANLQNLKGTPISAVETLTNAQIAPLLGRNLAACGTAGTCTATASIQLIEPNTVFEPRLTQLDLRLTKIFPIGKVRIRGMFDVYNVFNESDVLGLSTGYAPDNRWLRPTSVLGARLFRLSGEITF